MRANKRNWVKNFAGLCTLLKQEGNINGGLERTREAYLPEICSLLLFLSHSLSLSLF